MSLTFLDAYEEHVWDVYGFFAYRLGSRADAEDLTQTTFERAFQAWSRYDERKASVRTWLLAIAHNALVDHHRRIAARPRETASPEEVAEHAGADHSTLNEPSLGLSPELEAALGDLSERERVVIALRFGADLRGPEIAGILGLSVANVHQILSRCLRKLRGALESSPEATAQPRVERPQTGEAQ